MDPDHAKNHPTDKGRKGVKKEPDQSGVSAGSSEDTSKLPTLGVAKEAHDLKDSESTKGTSG